MIDLGDYRTCGEAYLYAIRRAAKEGATDDDQFDLVKYAGSFQEYLLLNISSLAGLIGTLDEDSLTVNDRAGLGSTIDELAVLAFDCMEVMHEYYAKLASTNVENDDPAGG